MGKVIVLTDTTVEPMTMIGEMAGICWGSDTKDHEANVARGLDCIRCNHGRTMEYPQIYLLIEGYSARVMRELYTHIGGAPTRLQESTRYVDMTDFDYVTPPSIAMKPSCNEIYAQHMEDTKDVITQLTQAGVKREDAAMTLPLGMTTKVVLRTNLRNFVDMCHTRLCSRAYWEFRQVMRDSIDSLCFYAPEWDYLDKEERLFVPKCEVMGYCNESKSCGRKIKREEYDELLKMAMVFKTLSKGGNEDVGC